MIRKFTQRYEVWKWWKILFPEKSRTPFKELLVLFGFKNSPTFDGMLSFSQIDKNAKAVADSFDALATFFTNDSQENI